VEVFDRVDAIDSSSSARLRQLPAASWAVKLSCVSFCREAALVVALAAALEAASISLILMCSPGCLLVAAERDSAAAAARQPARQRV